MIFHNPTLSNTKNYAVIYCIRSENKITTYIDFKTALKSKIINLIDDELEIGRSLESVISETETYLNFNFITYEIEKEDIKMDLVQNIMDSDFFVYMLENAKDVFDNLTETEIEASNFEAIIEDTIMGSQNTISMEMLSDIFDDLTFTLFLSHLSQVLD